MNTTQPDILLIEDSIEDVDLIRTAVEKSLLNPRIFVVTDGQKALEFLYKVGDYKMSKNPI
jgi:CheY-like chemotaxis protein